MEKRIQFQSGNFAIEGLYNTGASGRGIVITHPHPLYGGNMDNNVVAALADVYRQLGYSTLRFNLRGVGGSQGRYDDGIGEQQDVAAAVAYLENSADVTAVDLAGYSFGAWVNACWVSRGATARRMVMVSPPVAFIDFKDLGGITGLKLVVTGDRDDIAPAAQIRRYLPGWNAGARFEIINGADHFYSGCFDQLRAILASVPLV